MLLIFQHTIRITQAHDFVIFSSPPASTLHFCTFILCLNLCLMSCLATGSKQKCGEILSQPTILQNQILRIQENFNSEVEI